MDRDKNVGAVIKLGNENDMDLTGAHNSHNCGGSTTDMGCCRGIKVPRLAVASDTNRVCLANEPCDSIEDCLFDKRCSSTLPRKCRTTTVSQSPRPITSTKNTSAGPVISEGGYYFKKIRDSIWDSPMDCWLLNSKDKGGRDADGVGGNKDPAEVESDDQTPVSVMDGWLRRYGNDEPDMDVETASVKTSDSRWSQWSSSCQEATTGDRGNNPWLLKNASAKRHILLQGPTTALKSRRQKFSTGNLSQAMDNLSMEEVDKTRRASVTDSCATDIDTASFKSSENITATSSSIFGNKAFQAWQSIPMQQWLLSNASSETNTNVSVTQDTGGNIDLSSTGESKKELVAQKDAIVGVSSSLGGENGKAADQVTNEQIKNEWKLQESNRASTEKHCDETAFPMFKDVAGDAPEAWLASK